jgi:hypothetical protein
MIFQKQNGLGVLSVPISRSAMKNGAPFHDVPEIKGVSNE